MNLVNLINLARTFGRDHEHGLWTAHPDSEKYPGQEVFDEMAYARIISRLTSHHIRARLIDTSAEVYGLLAPYSRRTPPTAYILLARGMSRCWRRFCIVKELVHLHHPERCLELSPTSTETMLRLSKESRFRQVADNEDLDYESMGIYMAIELMIPWRFRGELSDLRATGKTNHQIAEQYLLPMAVVDQYFDCHYAECSARIHLTA